VRLKNVSPLAELANRRDANVEEAMFSEDLLSHAVHMLAS